MVSKDNSNFVNLAVDSRSISVYWGMLNFVIHSIEERAIQIFHRGRIAAQIIDENRRVNERHTSSCLSCPLGAAGARAQEALPVFQMLPG